MSDLAGTLETVMLGLIHIEIHLRENEAALAGINIEQECKCSRLEVHEVTRVGSE
jgi:hypothetical protein